MKVLIVGAGYAGINAYHRLGRRHEVKILSAGPDFVFHTAKMRDAFFGGVPSSFRLPDFVARERVREVDVGARVVLTDAGRHEPDVLVLAQGCRRDGVDRLFDEALRRESVSLAAAYRYDDYLALQAAFYLRALGKKVAYRGEHMRWLGDDVGDAVSRMAEEAGIVGCEAAEFELPPPLPAEPFDSFLKVDDHLKVKDCVYAAGDIADMGPKLGEMAMRMGMYVASQMDGTSSGPFRPRFVYILDNGAGRAAHVRSDVPWGGGRSSVRVSRMRSLMKRFIERYYMIRKGKMGFLSRM
ncbi:MAG: NAD(P)/FAD-dependent oxidoreductase [Nitrososphaerota archaeon]|nr:NAD(P)/FAD-dependent oxidoreductase [Nitrososphaerota archaeon]